MGDKNSYIKNMQMRFKDIENLFSNDWSIHPFPVCLQFKQVHFFRLQNGFLLASFPKIIFGRGPLTPAGGVLSTWTHPHRVQSHANLLWHMPRLSHYLYIRPISSSVILLTLVASKLSHVKFCLNNNCCTILENWDWDECSAHTDWSVGAVCQPK